MWDLFVDIASKMPFNLSTLTFGQNGLRILEKSREVSRAESLLARPSGAASGNKRLNQ